VEEPVIFTPGVVVVMAMAVTEPGPAASDFTV
jgi:hypothetical protein